jgi:hypothetical protein
MPRATTAGIAFIQDRGLRADGTPAAQAIALKPDAQSRVD